MFWHRAHIIVLLLLATLFSASCSISVDDGPAEPLTLPSNSWEPELSFHMLDRDHRTTLYGVSRSGREFDPPVYASALRSCSIAEGEKLPTVARRLFVGLEHLRIMRREQHKAGDLPLLLLAFEATLDDTPLQIVSLSAVVDGCAIDLAFWSALPARTTESSSSAGLSTGDISSGGAFLAAQSAIEHLSRNQGEGLEELADQ